MTKRNARRNNDLLQDIKTILRNYENHPTKTTNDVYLEIVQLMEKYDG